MKKASILLMIAVLLALGGQAFGEMCANDAVPAATLLLPYFEVDTTSDSGVTTLFSINNASAAPAIAHVTIWTNWSNPVIDFDVFLTGYDVQTINLRDVIVSGLIPVTADEDGDGADTISPHGDNPQWDDAIGECGNLLPYAAPPAAYVGNVLADRLLNGTLGNALTLGSAAGNCLGEPAASGHAVGYITIDNVVDCNTLFPGDASYRNLLSDDNYLWGDWYLVDPANDFASGDTLVHIEAANGFGEDQAESGNGYTFYGRFYGPGNSKNPGVGDDDREPLGSTWGVRYLQGGVFSGGTDLLVWRDSTNWDESTNGHSCSGGPNWLYLNETQVVAFDEQENAIALCYIVCSGSVCNISPPGDPNDPLCFPLETQRTEVGVEPLAPPFDFGWLYLNLNTPDSATSTDWDPLEDPSLHQSHVAAIHSAEGRYSVGLNAIQLRSACDNCGGEDDPCVIVGEGIDGINLDIGAQ